MAKVKLTKRVEIGGRTSITMYEVEGDALAENLDILIGMIELYEHPASQITEPIPELKSNLPNCPHIPKPPPEKTEPLILKRGCFDVQVCVPAEWTDELVMAFANRENPSGTENGWRIRRQGDKAMGSNPERNPCEKRKGFVHIVLDA